MAQSRTVTSSRHGSFQVIIDDEDVELFDKYTWNIMAKGRLTKHYYIIRGYAHGYEYLHRLITNCPKGLVVDHINGNVLDNRRCNLRICTRGQNATGSAKVNMPTSSKYKGVTWDKEKKKWLAQIKYLDHKTGKRIAPWLGRYDNEEDAARAYNEAAIKYHGEFARLNKIEGDTK